MALATVSLDDKYTLESGRIFITGTQALVRLPMLQRQRDAAAGLNTACFISGYRGSPLALYDRSLWSAKAFLKKNHIHFEPGVNEDLAATAIWGSQQLNLFPRARYDGVFALWYGKGPGLDRTLDVLRHANFAGASRHGGVLVLAGDDHNAVSSTTAHQAEFTFQSLCMPVLHPASVQEYLEYGLLGIALSRFSGLWIGFKCVTETIEGSASIDLDPASRIINTPDVPLSPDGMHIRWPDPILAQEFRVMNFRLPAALAFARANGVDRDVIASPRRRLGIVTTGKSYLDVRQALDDLGICERQARDIGLSLYKVGMVWPLEPEGMRAFAEGHETLLVVEEKRPVIETQMRDLLYALPDGRRPRIIGKHDENGAPLLASTGELRPTVVAQVIARALAPFHTTARITDRLAFITAKERQLAQQAPNIERRPYFCSGCPHNSSTKVPEGSRALAGIGCHFLAAQMNRTTATYSQMGGEGVAWVGQAPFTDESHVFANLGDGTYYHSGILAIRAAVAARVNITYKILYNDAVAMTGGQPVDGPLSVADITQQVAAEGVKKIVLVSDDPGKFGSGANLAHGVTIHHRDDLDAVQKSLREIEGCTVLVYEQTCAAEKRRRRSRGKFPDPDRRVFINEAVCEGCGDCSVKSNCVSVEPLETAFGRKRKINQSACNKDFSCLNGFCPSFVTVEGAKVRRSRPSSGAGNRAAPDESLPIPQTAALTEPYGVLVTGIGGTGVVTIGAVLAMAAHIEGLGVTVLDQTGLAQKNGAVMSHVRIGPRPDSLHAVRIGTGGANLLLACDVVTAASPAALETMESGGTHAVVNSHLAPTADFTLDPDMQFHEQGLMAAIRSTCGDNLTEFFDASGLATALMGDAIATNMFMLGHAFQRGLLPISLEALRQAITVNGAAVEANQRAFAWGRLHAHDARAVEVAAAPESARAARPAIPQTLEDIVAHRSAHLAAWQNEAWAGRYRALVETARAAEAERARGMTGFAEAVARNAAKLMSYKDEYEVARLYTDGAFHTRLAAQFDGDFRISFHLAPPLIAPRDPNTGELKKMRFGGWMFSVLRQLARWKGLRGTAFDPFGYTAERKAERQLIESYFALIDELCAGLTTDNHALAVELANLPEAIRGFGHVKERNIKAAKMKEEKLLAAFRAPVARVHAAE